MLRSTFLFLTALFVGASCYSCANSTTIKMPSDISKPLFYPSDWNGEGSVPMIDGDSRCQITMEIPKGYYATVTFYKHTGVYAGASLVYSNRRYQMIPEDDQNPYIFVNPRILINLDLLSSNRFAFKAVFQKFPDVQKNMVDVYKGNPPVVVSANNQMTTFRGEPYSQISLMAFTLSDPSKMHLLRQTAIFDNNGDFAGTLDQIITKPEKLTFYYNIASVYTFGISDFISEPLFMAQDNSDTNSIYTYSGLNFPSSGNYNATLNGRYGPSVTVTHFDGSEFVKGFNQFPDTATINVYENGIYESTLVATLNSSNYASQLPLEVKGVSKFYELVGYGNVNMVISRDSSRASRISV